MKNAPGKVTQGKSGLAPDCTITVGDDDFVGMMSGKLSAQNLFMGGKLKVKQRYEAKTHVISQDWREYEYRNETKRIGTSTCKTKALNKCVF